MKTPVGAWLALVALCVVLLVCRSAVRAEETRGLKLLATKGADNQWAEIPLYNRMHAVIIGIDRYPQLPPDRQLGYAVSDAKAVERLLRARFAFDQIYTLYNEDATRSNITDLLLNRLSQVPKDDGVFVFYAGHGGQEKTDFGNMGFLVPHDGSFEDMRTVITMGTLRDDVSKRIRAKHVFFVMDACYSGILVETRAGEAKKTSRDFAYLEQIAREPVRQVLTAGDANQTVLDGGPGGHSVFTGRLLEILESADDFITASELGTRIKERVFSDARARNHTQTPKDGAFFGLGDFIFMPSVARRIGGIKGQTAELEKELARLQAAEARAAAQRDEGARREAERARRATEAALKAKQLEAQRIEAEQQARAKEQKQRQQQQEEMRRSQEEEAARLAAIQKQVEEKRKQYKASMVDSLADALRELQALDAEIQRIRSAMRQELSKRILSIAAARSRALSHVAQKDEFETDAEFSARQAAAGAGRNGSIRTEFKGAGEALQNAYDEQIRPLLQQMDEISKKSFRISGHDALTITIGSYDADAQTFPVTITSKNFGRQAYPWSRFLFVAEDSRSTHAAGLRAGDMLVSYNSIPVRPDTDFERLWATVVTESTELVVERDGRPLVLKVPKGGLSLELRADDYGRDLPPDVLYVSADIPVPRADARRLKQDYLNGFFAAELDVAAVSPQMLLVRSAMLADEGCGSRYDLMKARFVSLGNRLTRDTNNKTIWLTSSLGKRSWVGAERLVSRLNYRGVCDWHLPSVNEMQSVPRTPVLLSMDSGICYHTNTVANDQNERVHWKYCPRDNSTYFHRDADSYAVQAVLSGEPKRCHYPLLEGRFLPISGDLVFDTERFLIWTTRPVSPDSHTSMQAETLVKELTYHDLRGWRLPSLDDLKSLYDEALPGISSTFGELGNECFHTTTLDQFGKHRTQNPTDPRWNCSDYALVVSVL
ncbi:MAG: caspase family protein [Deltaproteobacteria bacterium]|nr:caspase family protein [Deltaproteobacteria bacterium]